MVDSATGDSAIPPPLYLTFCLFSELDVFGCLRSDFQVFNVCLAFDFFDARIVISVGSIFLVTGSVCV